MLDDLAISIEGDWVAGTAMASVAVTSGPAGGVPVAVPALLIPPASTSAWVVV